MNKQEYMYNLYEALTPFGDEVRQEIIDDYEEHFSMGLSDGKTEEQIIAELGSIDELVDELKGLSSDEKKDKTTNSFEFDAQKFNEKVNEFTKNFATALGSVAASISNGAENLYDKAVNNGTQWGENIVSGISEMGEKVASKSSEIANDFKTGYDKSRNEKETVVPEESSYEGDVKNLLVDMDCGEILTDISKDGAFHVYYKNYGSQAQQLAYKFDYTSSGDTAYVTVKKQGGTSGFFARLSSPKVEVKLEIPENFGSVSIKSGAGNIHVDSVICERFDVKLAAGNFSESDCIIVENTVKLSAGNATIENIKCDNVSVKDLAGNVKISGLAREVSARSNAGNIKVDAEVKEAVYLCSNAGNITAVLKNCDGYSANIRKSVGNVNLEFRGAVTSTKGTGKFVMGDGSVIVECDSSVGNVTVEA